MMRLFNVYAEDASVCLNYDLLPVAGDLLAPLKLG